MACINLVLEENHVDVIIKALGEKLKRINSVAIVSGVMNRQICDDYTNCENALEYLVKAKGSLVDQRAMVDK